MSAPGTCLTGWRWLKGRASRGEYALWLTVILPWHYLAMWTQNSLVQLILPWALLFQTIRRLHDLGLSGWWIAGSVIAEVLLAIARQSFPDQVWPYLAVSLFPWACLLLAIVWPGSTGPNRFGPPPATWPWIRSQAST
ncbi:MAG: DUF805 domain-containing protein [Phenylobacterium sp.]|nr:DUF805 domain-containing protein [Phenylobacterium sp.]